MDLILIFALGAMLCWGVADFLMQKSARKMGDVETMTWIGLIGSIGLFPFIIPQITILSTWFNIGLLSLLGLTILLATILDLEALKIGKLSVIDMVISLELPFTVALGIVFLKDTVSFVQFLLIIFLMWGIAMIAVTKKKIAFKLEKGVFIAFGAAIAMALVNFLTAFSAKSISPLMAIWYPWLLTTDICLIFLIKKRRIKTFFSHAHKNLKLIIWMGIIDTGAWVFYAFAIHEGELSIITAITESYPVIALMLGLFINKEIITRSQVLGITVAVLASFLLALTI